ncbi:MAG: ABC transporter permease [Bryobacteraceae bacterium]
MIFDDAKYAARSLRKSPSMTLTALAALALGIGANTALFTVVNAVLLRPMNYQHPERIVEITRSWQGGKFNWPAVSPTKYDFWRRENRSFEAVGAYSMGGLGVNLAGPNEPERLSSLPVTADFFRVLGFQPYIGRTFTEAEDKPGAGHVAVISYALWQRLFHGDKKAVGSTLSLNMASYTILGVMPANFEFPESADLWTPMQLKIDPADHANDYSVIARLKPGVSLGQAAADMHRVGLRFGKEFGRGVMMGKDEDVGVIDFHSWVVGNVRPTLLVLMGAVGFVLLIACANVANLLLARSAVRRNEMAVRAALGASGHQLMRLLLTESLMLSISGAVLGIVLAQSAVPLLLQLAPANLPLTPHVELGWSVFLFAAAIGILTGLLFGLFPAMQSLRLGIGNPLREAGTRTTRNASANRARQMLVVAEVAISLVLLVGAGLLIETFKNLSGVEPGFDAHHVLTMKMSVSDERFQTTAATASMAKRVLTRLEAIPGVAAVGTITALPTELGFDDPFEIIGRPPSDEVADEFMRVVSPHYFSALRIPVVAGRAFTEQDTQEGRGVIIINQALARKYFPHENPIGQQMLVGRIMGPIFADKPREIVGVVGDTRDGGLGEPAQPIYFEPLAQLPDGIMALTNQLVPVNWVIRTSGDPLVMAERIRRETLTASGGVPMAEPRLLERVVGDSIARQRFTMTLLGVFAGMAMLLGAIGLYGVISYSVAQRTRELGIRAALGAARTDLARLVITQGMILVGVGLAVGLVAALGLTQFLKSMLYGVTAFDPGVLASVTALLAAVALAACWLPALRAARVDPVIALREQ